MQKTDLAIEDFTKHLFKPRYSDAYRNRGITYKYTGTSGACRDWLKARNLSDGSVQSWLIVIAGRPIAIKRPHSTFETIYLIETKHDRCRALSKVY